MEHWFDALARPHDRRAALKTALVAGSALLLPAVRVPRAWGTEGEPCFVPCQQAAKTAWDAAFNRCRASDRANLLTIATGGLGPHAALAALFGYLQMAATADCFQSAELTYHRSALACRGSECGNPDKYPGGAAKPKPPPPKCDPVEEKACGDMCCNIITDCCASKNGGYVCFAAGHNCEGA